MGLSGLLDPLTSDPALAEALHTARSGVRRDLDLVAPAGIRPFSLAGRYWP